MAYHDTVSTTATLEGVSQLQGLDAHPAVNQAHPSPASRLDDAENHYEIRIVAGNSSSTHHISVIAESSLAANGVQELITDPQVNQAHDSPAPRFAIAENDQSCIVHPGNSSDITEPVEVFRFADLASEIRNRIYHIVLGPLQDPSICLTQVVDDRPFKDSSGDTDLKFFRTKRVALNRKHRDSRRRVFHQVKPHDLSILLVSKQIYVEAFHVFYAKNCFFFTDTGMLYRFLKNIGHIRRQHLTMIYFHWCGPDAKEAFRLLKTCRRLKVVQFNVPCSHPPGYEALKEVRVKTAKARALVHFGTAQNPPLNIHDHTSCFGDYKCHCLCRRPYEPRSHLGELERAMMRPRREHDLPDAEETFDLFKPTRERFKRSEEQDLLHQKATFDEFINNYELQGKELRYLGRRNKVKEAAQNQTLTGAAADEYHRDFSDKLAADNRLLRRKEYWTAKLQRQKEQKEREAQRDRDAKALDELKKNTRRVTRELNRKFAREAKERAKREAREARELKWRETREAREREKVVKAEARAEKKMVREEKERAKVVAREARALKKG